MGWGRGPTKPPLLPFHTVNTSRTLRVGRERSFFPLKIANAVQAELWRTGVGVQDPFRGGLEGSGFRRTRGDSPTTAS